MHETVFLAASEIPWFIVVQTVNTFMRGLVSYQILLTFITNMGINHAWEQFFSLSKFAFCNKWEVEAVDHTENHTY